MSDQVPQPTKRRKWTGWLGAVVAFALKFKLLFSLLTVLGSVFIYGWAFGFPFAIGFVLILAIHEMGHVAALRLKGLPAPPPVFIPFMGAAIFLSRNPQSAADEAFVAGGGPVAGWVASALAAWLFVSTANPLFGTIAYLGFFLQAFNLIPMSPLDGGRMVAAVDRRLWWVGLPILAAVVIFIHSFFAVLIAIIIGVEFFARVRAPADPRYYQVSARDRILTLVVWLSLLLLSVLGMVMLQGVA